MSDPTPTPQDRVPEDVSPEDVAPGDGARTTRAPAYEPSDTGRARLDLGAPPPVEVRRGDLSMIGGRILICPRRSYLLGPTLLMVVVWGLISAALAALGVVHEADFIARWFHVGVVGGGGFVGSLVGSVWALRKPRHISYEVANGRITALRDGGPVTWQSVDAVRALKFDRYAGPFGFIGGPRHKVDGLPEPKRPSKGRDREVAPRLQLWVGGRDAADCVEFPQIAVYGRRHMEELERDLRRACGLPDEP